MAHEHHSPLGSVGLRGNEVDDIVDRGLHGRRLLVLRKLVEIVDHDSGDGDSVQVASVSHIILILLDGRERQVVVEGFVLNSFDPFRQRLDLLEQFEVARDLKRLTDLRDWV